MTQQCSANITVTEKQLVVSAVPPKQWTERCPQDAVVLAKARDPKKLGFQTISLCSDCLKEVQVDLNDIDFVALPFAAAFDFKQENPQ